MTRWTNYSTAWSPGFHGAGAQIRGPAEGVPLYAVETVRMLLDRGLLARRGDRFELTGPMDTLDVPESLQSLIAARLDGLPPTNASSCRTARYWARLLAGRRSRR